jgi:transcriptional regulator with GAF, ATPase, and Fis domain
MPWLVYNDKQGELITYEIEKPQTIIGRRSESSDVVLRDASVSREHAEVRTERNRCVICDKGSLNHTYVNGKEVQRAPLKHNDIINIGNFALRFLRKLPAERQSVRAGEEEITIPAGWQSVERMGDEGVCIAAESNQPVTGEESVSGVGQKLRFLLDIGEITAAVYSVEDIMSTVSAKLFEATPAERCFLLLKEGPGQPMKVRCAHQKDRTRPTPEVAFSRKVLETVVREKKAILCNNAMQDARFGGSESIRNQNILSMISAPLVVRDEVIGILHLDNLSQERAFSKDDLRLVQTVALHLSGALAGAVAYSHLKADHNNLARQIESRHLFIGSSDVVQKTLARAKKFALSDAPILLTGETGTGKEILARNIHLWSKRHDKPFVAVDCGLFTKELINSELFGYEKGAFTGAIARKIGKLENGNGGTIFFDEIANLDLEIQSNLLRVLQEYEFQRIGGNVNIKVDIRIVTATNTDLFAAVEKGTFRSDLLNRLNVCEVYVPPLRDRKGDIPELVEFFIERHRGESLVQRVTLEDGLVEVLMGYDWSGNVRQLENAIRRLIISSEDGVLKQSDLPGALTGQTPLDVFEGESYHDIIKNFKRELIRKVLAESEDKQTEAARKLGIQQSYLSKIMKNLDLR